MKIVVPIVIQHRIISALEKAGNHEIGGIIMGEHVGTDEFRICDLTIQTRGGTLLSFIRLVSSAVTALKKFFEKTNQDYTRFNYLGEWHSHPSFDTVPSRNDVHSMSEIINDREVSANFVVLIIVKLNKCRSLEGSATAFYPGSRISQCDLIFDS